MTALLNAAAFARTTPAIYVVEDAHWIDAISEAMLADSSPSFPGSTALVVITLPARIPRGPSAGTGCADDFARAAGPGTGQGSWPPKCGYRPIGRRTDARIVEQAPETRFSLRKSCATRRPRRPRWRIVAPHVPTRLADVDVRATVQAAIAARIDRLVPARKGHLYAAPVSDCGSRRAPRSIADTPVDRHS